MISRRHIPVVACLLWASAAAAHGTAEPQLQTWWKFWSWEPAAIVALCLSAGLYACGIVRLWRAAGIGAGVRGREVLTYAGGWFALSLALVSPLHPLGKVLFSAHMGQHEVLMVLAAPLLVLGRPLLAFLWAMPRSWRAPLGSFVKRPPIARLWAALTLPLVAWSIHAAALWIWHIPALFEATLRNDLVHHTQHLSFLGSALLFWWALMRRSNRASRGVAVLYIFTTSLHSGLLGALLTFATSLWYPSYGATTQAWGLTPLEDQQLGGLLMWIPAGLVYMLAALALIAGWLRESRPMSAWSELLLDGRMEG